MGRYAFLAGEVVPIEEAKISIQTHAFLYGTAVFEGIRAYWVEEEEDLLIFRPREHYVRLVESGKILHMKPEYTVDEMCEITVDILRRNGDRQDMYIRPILYKSNLEIGPRLSGLKDDFLLFTVPMGDYVDTQRGLRVRVSSWRHTNDNAIPPRAKVNGAYVNASLAKTEAVDDGYDEAIFLTSDGHVSEGSAMNLFIVRRGKLVTPPITDDILEGITRETVMTLATEELGLEVVERSIDRTELYVAEEAFFVGTGAQVSPITEIDRRPVGDGQIGPISNQIQALYFDVVRGRVPKYRHWCLSVKSGKYGA